MTKIFVSSAPTSIKIPIIAPSRIPQPAKDIGTIVRRNTGGTAIKNT